MSAADIRARLPHPVVDVDGHMIEYFPALSGYLRKEGVDPSSPTMRRLVPGAFGPTVEWHSLTPGERARRRVTRPPWWGSPARNTRDLATAMFPALLHERLPELGIDFSVVYPSVGLVYLHLEDERERRATCRALNRYNADAFADFRDRLCAVAAIPMVTPDEAIDELEHAVGELGFRAVVMNGFVQRPAEAFADAHPDLARWGMWLDTYGVDSAYDYDPVWRRCVELRVNPTFHSGSQGWGARRSVTNFVYNHTGHFAAAGEATCKSLFLGGVTKRFPGLRFAFLEGGVAWGCSLYADLLAHWEKRNRRAMDALDPSRLDRKELVRLFREYGEPAQVARIQDLVDGASVRGDQLDDDYSLDEFAACGIERAEDVRDRFVPSFYFGCEADDPLNAWAFDARSNPFGARLHAIFGSDIGHWDVRDVSEVVEEAWELVEHGLISKDDFRAFTFENSARFWTTQNPDFFAGTSVESAVRSALA